MPGLYFDKNNTFGHVTSVQFPVNYGNAEYPYIASNESDLKVWLVMMRGPESDDSPVVKIGSENKEGNDHSVFYIRLEEGKLKARLTSYDRSDYIEFITNDPLPINELLEIAVICAYPGRYNDYVNRIRIYINGASVPVTRNYYTYNASNFRTYIQVSLGKEDYVAGVARDLFIKDVAIIPDQYAGINPGDFKGYYGKWQSDFSNGDDLRFVCTKDNGGGESPVTFVESGVSWIEGDGLPDAGPEGSGGIIIPGNGNTTRIEGTITEDNHPAVRRVFAITQSLLAVTGTEESKHAVLDSTLSDTITGAYTLNTSPYEEEVLVLAMDDYGKVWQPDTAYQVGGIIRPPVFQGYVYHCTIAGSSDATEPQWWFDVNNDQSIGTAQFKAKPYTRPLAHGPLVPEIVPESE